jgi:hypothetical protein
MDHIPLVWVTEVHIHYHLEHVLLYQVQHECFVLLFDDCLEEFDYPNVQEFGIVFSQFVHLLQYFLGNGEDSEPKGMLSSAFC